MHKPIMPCTDSVIKSQFPVCELVMCFTMVEQDTILGHLIPVSKLIVSISSVLVAGVHCIN